MVQPKGPVQVIADRVRQYRTQRGWSVRELAERCAAAGLPLNRGVLTNLETGKRAAISIDELLVLADVLRVPFPTLFIPVGDTRQFQITPTRAVDPYAAYLWVTGRVPRMDQGLDTSSFSDPEDVRMWARANQPLTLLARLLAASTDFEATTRLLAEARKAGDDERIASGQQQRLADLRRGAAAFDDIIEAGLVPPSLPAPFAEALVVEGLVRHPDLIERRDA